MEYSLASLKRDVMARLGEIPWPKPSLSAAGMLSPSEILEQKIATLLPEVGSKLLLEAPLEKLDGGLQMDAAISLKKMSNGLYSAELSLPSGFLRLVEISMAGWKRSVDRVIMPGSGEWEWQSSEESGISGSPERPRVYQSGGKLRCLASESSSDTLATFRGCKIPVPDENGVFFFPKSLFFMLKNEIFSFLT